MSGMVGRLLRWQPAYSTAVIVAGVFLLSWAVDGRSVSLIALRSMLPAAGILAIAGVGETLVVQQRGVDLSVPGVIALTAYVVSDLPIRYGISPALAFLVTIVLGLVVGLVSGMIITKVGVSPIVVTFGMNSLLVGLVIWYSGTQPVTTWAGLQAFATGRWLGVSFLTWIGLCVVVVAALVESFTKWGRRFAAVGASPGAARIAGLAVGRYVTMAYVIAAGCYSLAGILLVGFVQTSSTSLGDPYLLSVFVVVIIGGTRLRGGKATMMGTGLAALALAQIDQAVLTLGATGAVQDLVEATVLVLAALMGVANVPQLWTRAKRLLGGPPGRRASKHGGDEATVVAPVGSERL
jgi:ribose transport system permease protein